MIKIIDDGMHKCNLFVRLHLVKGGCVARLAKRYLDPFVYKSIILEINVAMCNQSILFTFICIKLAR